ncbi:N-acetylmuramoyl-L-alanine amidase family protein [Streptomyces griseoflavus]|uniref:peptidoglycan recognition protein family protein n=1 Tax=Streptomyces rimosus TaxID=1927 RepID=UPI0004C7E853|nr:peptidoglycan recognition protein [Streptomyces rimosus]KOG57365.1 N-acetylmuramoyl-L-alanine amidase family protein [Streptomyces griseoflavus]
MRAILATSIAVTCTAALTLPLALPAGATAPERTATSTARAARAPSAQAAPAGIPGTTRSLPLRPLRPSDRAAATGAQGLAAYGVAPFSLVGVVWDDPAAALDGRAQVRTRPAGGTGWSGWQDIQAHDDDAPDPRSSEGHGGSVRGSTAPLWVGPSDAVELRVVPERDGAGRAAARRALPAGMHLELVDPGEDSSQVRAARTGAGGPKPPDGTGTLGSVGSALGSLLGVFRIPAVNTPTRPRDDGDDTSESRPSTPRPGTSQPSTGSRSHVGPRPAIVTRAGWGADEKLRERNFAYTRTVKAAFLHHSATGNNYTCRQAPSVLRSIYRYHVKSSGWRDLGYNFLIDKCGTVYEGRAGGVTKPVKGAHTRGFNEDTMGIAVLGTFENANPPSSAVSAVARLTAWKLGLYGMDPRTTTSLVSGGGNRYKKGTRARLHVISGHRDGFSTECPGDRLYGKLGSVRSSAARLQGR